MFSAFFGELGRLISIKDYFSLSHKKGKSVIRLSLRKVIVSFIFFLAEYLFTIYKLLVQFDSLQNGMEKIIFVFFFFSSDASCVTMANSGNCKL